MMTRVLLRIHAAETMTRENLARLDELGWHGHVAHAHVLLGLCALKAPRPDLEAAREHLARARRWTSRTGEVEVLLRALTLDAEIGLAMASPDAARHAIREGLALSEACGFGAFTARFERWSREMLSSHQRSKP